MTTTQELLKSSFELNLNNYGPEDVERLNDWAIKAYRALEALQTEHTDEVMRGLMLEKAHAMGLAERDAALARLAELAKQEPVIYQAKTKPGFLSTSVYAWEDCEKADFLVYEADGVHVRGLYAAAGASPVEPSQAQPEPVNVGLMELLEPAFTEIQHVLGSTLEVPYQRKSLETALELVRAAIAVIKQSQPDYEAMHKKGFQAFDCPVCGFDGALGFQPAAQPSQAGELNDAKRLDWIRDQLFEHKWNGVVGKGCAVQWVVAPDFRFKQRELTDDSGIAAGDFRRAIDAAINVKERAAHGIKQGGQQ